MVLRFFPSLFLNDISGELKLHVLIFRIVGFNRNQSFERSGGRRPVKERVEDNGYGRRFSGCHFSNPRRGGMHSEVRTDDSLNRNLSTGAGAGGEDVGQLQLAGAAVLNREFVSGVAAVDVNFAPLERSVVGVGLAVSSSQL